MPHEHPLEPVGPHRAVAGGGRAGSSITFEFGDSIAANAFWERNPLFLPSFERVAALANATFGRLWQPANRLQDVTFGLGEACRGDFLEIAFLAVNGYGVGALKLLRGLYERAVTLEFIRLNPDKAERFVRYGVIQELRVLKAAIDAVGEEEVHKHIGAELAEYESLGAQIRPDFLVTDCKKCGTRRLAHSWDVDVASMVKRLSQPYQLLYMASYALPNLHIHATATSAFGREPNFGTPEEKNIHECEAALIHATLLFVLVLQSQNEVFSLGLDPHVATCWDEVMVVWKSGPYSSLQVDR